MWDPLFGSPAELEGFGSALLHAEASPDSRGTVACEQPLLSWQHLGTSVSVKQGITLGDTADSVWAEALALCRYLSNEPDPELDRGPLGRTLDLGAGTGLLGLWLTKAHLVDSMILADRLSRLPALRANLALNGLVEQATPRGGQCPDYADPIVPLLAIRVAALLWGDVAAARKLAGSVDVVLASSIIYDSTQHDALLQTLLVLAAPRLILNFAHRDLVAEQSFMSRLSHEVGYSCRLAETTHPAESHTPISIWECSRMAPTAVSS